MIRCKLFKLFELWVGTLNLQCNNISSSYDFISGYSRYSGYFLWTITWLYLGYRWLSVMDTSFFFYSQVVSSVWKGSFGFKIIRVVHFIFCISKYVWSQTQGVHFTIQKTGYTNAHSYDLESDVVHIPLEKFLSDGSSWMQLFEASCEMWRFILCHSTTLAFVTVSDDLYFTIWRFYHKKG